MKYQGYLDQYQSNSKTYHKRLKALGRVPGKVLDQQFGEAHKTAFSEIDCLACANCCKTISPIFRMTDIERIAQSMRMKAAEFIDRYLYIDDEGDYVLQQTPCPFLGTDNFCSIYDTRPKACREYPHTDHKDMRKHLPLARKNLKTCPAVVRILQDMG